MNATATADTKRLKLTLRGAVQGVGFRPFVFRLAKELRLRGRVSNSAQGVFIEAEGTHELLEHFLARLATEKPPHSFIQSLEMSWLDAVGFEGFEIRESETSGDKSALVLPDIAACPDCLREIFDPKDRRYLYPFTNCTNCGPRFSIIELLPYDRANTSMKSFEMCPQCRAEYENPENRRFHAQPNACPKCGPKLELWNPAGEEILGDHQALRAAAHAIRRGKIVAVKGIGGFHLMVDARNENAVRRLRERKHREEKPFALLFPSLDRVKTVCEVSHTEERLLCSPEAPIVLLKRCEDRQPCCEPDELSAVISANCDCIALSVAPGNPNLGVMLPSNPLHHLLMAELKFPVVATSGNLSDEPICTDEFYALERLRGIADLFLVHNRPVVRHVDDSIVRVVLDHEMILRRARGYAPLPITLHQLSAINHQPVLAVGAHLKNSIALAIGENTFISQHIGDLETEQVDVAFRRATEDLPKLYEANPQIVAADLHPDYFSTQFARDSGQKVFPVQHHVAHVLSCVAENEVALPVLGVSWDGTGYGTDGTIWGGEFFLIAKSGGERVAHLRPFRLPGGDSAVKEPRRAALGLLHEIFGDTIFDRKELPSVAALSPIELSSLKGMLQRNLNSPATSSAGRLFDTVASLVGLRQIMHFEGQAAMELEFALSEIQTNDAYHLEIVHAPNGKTILDWQPMILEILGDLKSKISAAEISAKFHNALAEAIIAAAKGFGLNRIVLSGGCFQNRYLTERAVTRLREENFRPYWPQRVPPNDGGISLGQIFAARTGINLKMDVAVLQRSLPIANRQS